MIQRYTWHVHLPGEDEGQVREHCGRAIRTGTGIMAYTGFLKGVDAQPVPEGLMLIMRVHGKDRWAAQGHARELGEKVIKAARLWSYQIDHVGMETEPNGWTLKDGQGRTPRPRPPKATAGP